MKIFRHLSVLFILILCLGFFLKTGNNEVLAQSCMQTCSDSCSAQLSSCYDFCSGCPYSNEGAFFSWTGVPGAGDVNCNEACYQNCSENNSQCGVQCGYTCGIPTQDP